jgi:hypothetical protein
MRKIKNKKSFGIVLIFLVIVIIIIFISLFLAKKDQSKLDCKTFSVDKCPSNCVICPPCEVCSSIVCQTKEYCENLGFNKSWYNLVKPPLK